MKCILQKLHRDSVMSQVASVVVVLCLLLLPGQVDASDGVLEINQACIAGGCFAGDPPGLPVQITSPGSYRLTSNIVLPDLFSGAFLIQGDNVTLDLNGFEIRGVNTCSFNQDDDIVCSFSLVGHGIFADNGIVRTEVRNGSVTGAGATGVVLGDQSTVRNVRTSQNGLGGIHLLGAGTILDCVASQNGGGNSPSQYPGIRATSASRIQGNSSYQNAGNGIQTADGSLVHGNVVYENDEHGIFVNGFRSSVQRNTVYRNDEDGINDNNGGGTTIADNTVSTNLQDGIQAGTGSAVLRNTVRLNGGGDGPGGVGLNLMDHATYSGNTITSNVTNQVVGGVNLGGNYCVGTGTVSSDCP